MIVRQPVLPGDELVQRAMAIVVAAEEMRDIVEVAIRQANDIELLMMFDAGHALDERILSEQFRY